MFDECKIEGEVKLTSGRKTDIFYDFYLLTPREVAEYVELLVTKIVPPEILKQASFIASPALGGVIPGFLFAFATKKPFVVIDKSGKAQGPETKGGKYLIVDDVVTSFQAANLVRRTLPESQCLGVVTYIFRGSKVDLDTQDIPAFYLARKEQEI